MDAKYNLNFLGGKLGIWSSVTRYMNKYTSEFVYQQSRVSGTVHVNKIEGGFVYLVTASVLFAYVCIIDWLIGWLVEGLVETDCCNA